MRINITFRTLHTCKICINDYYTFLNKNEHKKLSLNFEKEFYLEVYPIDTMEKYYPILVKFEYNSELASESSQIQIIELCSKNYEIILNPLQAITPSNSFKKFEKDINNKHITIDNGRIDVATTNKNLSFNINKELTNPKINVINNLIFVANTSETITNLFVIDDKLNKIKYFKCNYYKIKDNTLYVINKLNDYAKHLRISTFNTNNIASLVSTYTAYKKHPKMIQNQKIIPYAFIQNIYAKDYKEARKYIENNFNTALTTESLHSFFGEFVSISTPKIDKNKNTICLHYKTHFNFYTSKYYTFEFENNKITNIYEYELKH